MVSKAITSSPDEFPSTSKRPRITDAPTSKKSELLSQKMSEVDEIVSTLTKKHSKSYYRANKSLGTYDTDGQT